jgi:Hint module
MRLSGEMVAISQVKVGDQVLAADATGRTFYSEVVFLPHGTNNEKAEFTHISTAAGSSVKMTPSHIIPAGSCGSSASLPLVYASKVRVGDCIMTVSGEEAVSAVESVQGEGLYTIVTKAEYLVVNGIIASPFGANHMMANMYYNIHRFLYTATPECLKAAWLLSANEVSADILKTQNSSNFDDTTIIYQPPLVLSQSIFLTFSLISSLLQKTKRILLITKLSGSRIHGTFLR